MGFLIGICLTMRKDKQRKSLYDDRKKGISESATFLERERLSSSLPINNRLQIQGVSADM